MELNKYIDHTELKPTATPKAIQTLCQEAKDYDFYAVCVHGCHLDLVQKELENSNVKIAAVVGFPLGAMSISAKVSEAEDYIKRGADEIDMVINIGWLKYKDLEKVEEDIKAVKEAIGEKVLKVIIETGYLTTDEKKNACRLALSAGADFVKTSTGFGEGGATLEDVQLMKDTVGGEMKIKASGGIRDKKTALEFIELGVDRIGASSGIAIVEG